MSCQLKILYDLIQLSNTNYVSLCKSINTIDFGEYHYLKIRLIKGTFIDKILNVIIFDRTRQVINLKYFINGWIFHYENELQNLKNPEIYKLDNILQPMGIKYYTNPEELLLDYYLSFLEFIDKE